MRTDSHGRTHATHTDAHRLTRTNTRTHAQTHFEHAHMHINTYTHTMKTDTRTNTGTYKGHEHISLTHVSHAPLSKCDSMPHLKRTHIQCECDCCVRNTLQHTATTHFNTLNVYISSAPTTPHTHRRVHTNTDLQQKESECRGRGEGGRSMGERKNLLKQCGGRRGVSF